MQVNWGTGLFRLWIVSAVLWWAVAGWVSWDDYRRRPFWEQAPPMPPELCKEAVGQVEKPDAIDWNAVADCERRQAGAVTERHQLIAWHIGVPLVPPLIVLGIGIALTWVARGFASPA